MRFEIFHGLPAYGPMAISFTRNGAREHREGLVVRFYPAASEPWVSRVIGGETTCNIVINHANKAYFVSSHKCRRCDPVPRAILDSMAWGVFFNSVAEVGHISTFDRLHCHWGRQRWMA